jgi:SAM-dependent methyltransferase
MNDAASQSKHFSRPFPATLICPKCGSPPLANPVCAATGEPCMSMYGDMPRFLFGQRYWGETGSEKMRELLQEAREGNWRAALQRCVGNEPISKHLLSPIRADFLHAMPWDRIRNVLDIGAGMGFMSCDMALYADSVVSLEAVPERAEFIQIRASQDKLNVYPIIASATALPFPQESFDLITLNGVFEYVGLWGDGDPKALQEQFLASSLRLLRPGGYLYVGIETRYASTAFFGNRDHSGLAFTSLMPRKLADLYCRMRSRPFYGSEHVATGYRTYTYTPLQYRSMFRRAGFDDVYVQGVFDGYNCQRALYEIDDYVGRKAVLDRINPPASMLGSLRRALTENRATYRTLENEVVVFAQKAAPGMSSRAMPWREFVSPPQTVIQVNQAYKTLAIVYDKGIPLALLEVEKKGQEDARRRLERSFEILKTLQSELKADLSSLPMRWPEPKGTIAVADRIFRRYEYIQGQSLAVRLLPRYYNEQVVVQLIERTVNAYVALCGRLSTSPGIAKDQANWATIREQLTAIDVSDDILRDFHLAVDAASNGAWRLAVIHGDFTPGNVLITPENELVLIDWEHFTTGYPIGADLIRFQQDAILESARLETRMRQRFESHLQRVINTALKNCGYEAGDSHHLHALYIAQQIAALGGESRIHQPLLEAYRSQRQMDRLRS